MAGNGTAGAGSNQLNGPFSIYLDGSDNLYVSDNQNCRIMKYLHGASNGTVVAGTTGVCGNGMNQLANSLGYLYVDSNNNLYVVDTGNFRVMRWLNGKSNGSIVAGNGTLGSSLSQLAYCNGVWVDSTLNLFVADSYNYRVMKWSFNASVGSVVAGVTGASGKNNDPFTICAFKI